MCGRFVQASKKEEVEKRFGVPPDPGGALRPRYNLAPSQPAALVTAGPRGRRLEHAVWGLVPGWAKDPRMGARMINARAETLWEKASYRNPLRYRRCLIPANGFYEWETRPGARKVPWYFFRQEEPLFAFAGLWEVWNDGDGGELFSFTIVTRSANDSVRPVHARMPLILPRAMEEAWLNHALHRPEDVHPLLECGAEIMLERRAVSPAVNAVANEGPALIEPRPPSPGEGEDGQLKLF